MENNNCGMCRHNVPEGVMVCDGCIHDQSRKDRFEPMTNGDRIRAMTDEALAEELADYLCNKIQDIGLCEKYKDCWQGCRVDYLRSPMERGNKP